MIRNQPRGPIPLRESDLSHCTGGMIVCGGPLLVVIKALETVIKEADKTTPPKQ